MCSPGFEGAAGRWEAAVSQWGREEAVRTVQPVPVGLAVSRGWPRPLQLAHPEGQWMAFPGLSLCARRCVYVIIPFTGSPWDG